MQDRMSFQAEPLSMAAGTSRRPTRSQGYLLWVVGNSWQRSLRSALEPIKLTYVQFLLLDGLGRFEEDGTQNPGQASLARRSGIDEMMTSQVLRTLETKRLIDRLPHPTDTRSKVISLTGDGRELLPRAQQIVHAADHKFFGGLGLDSASFILAIERLAIERLAGTS